MDCHAWIVTEDHLAFVFDAEEWIFDAAQKICNALGNKFSAMFVVGIASHGRNVDMSAISEIDLVPSPLIRMAVYQASIYLNGECLNSE